MITPKQLLALTAKWLAISALVVFCTIWLTDELSFQYKVHTSDSSGAFGAVNMLHMLAIEKKGNKVEYTMDRTQSAQVEKCVNSLFPHAGLKPCWYLLQQSQKARPMIILPFLTRRGTAVFDLRTDAFGRLLTPLNALRYSAFTSAKVA
jgi:hypothetical protein